MARRQIPVHETMLKPGRGILESLADRLGVEAPPEEPADHAPALASQTPEPDIIQADAWPPRQDQAAETSRGDAPDPAQEKSSHTSGEPFRTSRFPSNIHVDARILSARGRQALYVRLPQAMHDYLADLAHQLSKTNRDASMTNIVAQAILEKFPDAMDPRQP